MEIRVNGCMVSSTPFYLRTKAHREYRTESKHSSLLYIFWAKIRRWDSEAHWQFAGLYSLKPFEQHSQWSHPSVVGEHKNASVIGPFTQQALRRDSSRTSTWTSPTIVSDEEFHKMKAISLTCRGVIGVNY